MPFLALMGFTKSWLLLLCSIVFGIVYFSNQPISNALLADITSNAHRGLGYGISFFLRISHASSANHSCFLRLTFRLPDVDGNKILKYLESQFKLA